MTVSAILAASAMLRTSRPARFGFGDAFAGGGQADDNAQAGIAQVQRVCVTLASVADDGDGLLLERREAAVFFIKSTWHSFLWVRDFVVKRPLADARGSVTGRRRGKRRCGWRVAADATALG